jgi:carboxyl-terminal processing protease
MKSANDSSALAPARSRKAAQKAGEAECPDGLADEPIYKAKQMHTVASMLKRIFTIATGAVLGTLLSVGVWHLAWSILSDRELNRATNQMRDVFRLVQENYAEEDKALYERLRKEALKGAVAALDPHSQFLDATDYAQLQSDLDGNFGGIGVQVEMRQGRVVVIAPMAGTPGERAGILRGDEIRSVDRRAVGAGASMEDVIELLRGKPGTRVQVGLYRPGTAEPVEVTLVREIIRQQSVRMAEFLEPGVGYIHLTDFSAQTGGQFREALRKLLDAGMTSLILDLRNNPGGLLQAAVEVAENFFRAGDLIVFTQGRRAGDREELRARLRHEPPTLAMIVLVNAGSASAAEVVTGALKDTERVVVVGERTFGKGSVQSLFKLKQGEGLRLTTALFYTPNGTRIHEQGIAPHVEAVMTPEEDNRLRIQRLRQDMRDPVEFEKRFDFFPIEDRQLQTALDILKGRRTLAARGEAKGT